MLRLEEEDRSVRARGVRAMYNYPTIQDFPSSRQGGLPDTVKVGIRTAPSSVL